MTDVTRQQIFAQAAKKLRQEFAELMVVPHNALKGGEAEKLVREFLADHLPKRFDVGSGFIIDPKNQLSRQCDLVIYDAFNCPVYRASETAAIFPSDNVAGVVEVKSRLDKTQLEDAWAKIAAAKSLAKVKAPNLPILMTTQTMGCVFAFESALTLEKLSEHYTDLLRREGFGRHIDAILVLDRGLLTLAAKPRGLPWSPLIAEGFGSPAAEGTFLGVGAQELGDDSLDGFLRMLLSQLIFFRQQVGHPGFNWAEMSGGGQVGIRYVGSITQEKDPAKREANLRRYDREAFEDLSQHSAKQTE